MRCTSDVASMAVMLLAEHGADLKKLNPDKLVTALSHCKIFKEKDGFIALSRIESYWSEERYLSQMILFVKPESRGRGVAGRLLERAKKYAKKEGVDLYVHGNGNLMNKHGFKEYYTNFKG
jgi:GNAT superfamily N-acetyltransferase